MKDLKPVRAVIFFLFLLGMNQSCEKESDLESGTFIDNRDNQSYNWVILKDGNKWMAENLNYFENGFVGGSSYYNNDTTLAESYGRLYSWYTALEGEEGRDSIPSGIQGICPNGWHLPSISEWTEMVNHYGGLDLSPYDSVETGIRAGEALATDGNSGMNLNFGGIAYYDFWTGQFEEFKNFEKHGNYLSSTSSAWSFSETVTLLSDLNLVIRPALKHSEISCRCIQN